jgi:hypothetical protein
VVGVPHIAHGVPLDRATVARHTRTGTPCTTTTTTTTTTTRMLRSRGRRGTGSGGVPASKMSSVSRLPAG